MPNHIPAPERNFTRQFHTDVYGQVLYVDERVGISTLGDISLVANLRLRPGYTTIRVPAAQLRRLLTLRRGSSNKKAGLRERVKTSSKPIPPVSGSSSQLTRTARRARYNMDGAPLRDWWPVG